MLFKAQMNCRFFLLCVACFFSQITTIMYYSNFDQGYEYTCFFPSLFFLVYVFLLLKKFEETRYPIVTFFYKALQIARFVVMPPLFAITGDACGIRYLTPSASSIEKAAILMLFELVVTAFLIFLISGSKSDIYTSEGPKNVQRFWNSGNRAVYLLFVIASGLLFHFFGNSKYINFFVLGTDTASRVSSEKSVGALQNLAIQCLMLAVIVVFVVLLASFKKKYDATSNRSYVYLSLVVSVFFIGLIIGESRASIIYSAVCSAILLFQAYPNEKKLIIRCVGMSGGFIILFMTIYKTFYAFRYESYAAAMQAYTFGLDSLSATLQSYFMGPEQVAINIEYAEATNVVFYQPIVDAIKTTQPLSFFLNEGVTTTSVKFNQWIYNGSQNTGYIPTACGYGYIYGGLFLSPLIASANILIASFFEKRARFAKTAEMMYLCYYCAIRFSFFLFENPPGIWGKVSIMLFTGGLLFWFCVKTGKHRKRYELKL